MLTLYHHPLYAASRLARLVLLEKSLTARIMLERPWEWQEDFLRLNPAGAVPVLALPQGGVVAGAWAVCEYLDEAIPQPCLLGGEVLARAEVRRLADWFLHKCEAEVTAPLVRERALPRSTGAPAEPAIIRAARSNLRTHLDYIGWLAERRSGLAGELLTLADLAAAAQLSLLDYLDEIRWDEWPAVREWYARIKSRPAMRPLLAETVPGLTPPAHYADLDF